MTCCKGGCENIKTTLEKPELNILQKQWALYEFANVNVEQDCAICINCSRPWSTTTRCDHDALNYQFIGFWDDDPEDVTADYNIVSFTNKRTWLFQCIHADCRKFVVGKRD